ncbi:MAG: nitroreductase family protein [Spirochaetales bacterium]|nr:nitroreductase family protein [Spirochaetales bacterium]
MIITHKDSCRACGACIAECPNTVLAADADGVPAFVHPERCIECGRCMARCPEGIIRINDLPYRKFASLDPALAVTPAQMDLFLAGKRSCRSFLPGQISEEDLKALLNAAQAAPTAMNSLEKGFIVIQNQLTISRIRDAVIKASRSLYFLFLALSRAPLKYFLPKETATFFVRARWDYFTLIQSAKEGNDHLFYHAPALVLFTGIAKDPMGKDNALFAMSNFMMAASSRGIGTCINGFTSAWPSLLARYVKVPRLYRVYGVLTAGYERNPFTRTIYRKDPSVLRV